VPTAFERRGLLARPGADLRQARASREIGIGFGGRNLDHRSTQADLPLERLPMKNRTGRRTSGQFLPLLAGLVRVEHESAVVETLEKHHPYVRQTVAIDRRERHGVGIHRLGLLGVLEPSGEQPQRLVGVGKVTRR
jgi:hypothetical protein